MEDCRNRIVALQAALATERPVASDEPGSPWRSAIGESLARAEALCDAGELGEASLLLTEIEEAVRGETAGPELAEPEADPYTGP